MSMQSRPTRQATGAAGQAELRALLREMGFDVVDTGQESWLPAELHERLRHDHEDTTVRAVRYMPDLLAYSPRFPLAYWDAKVNATPGTHNFSIEVACYNEQMARTRKGERVVLAFKDTDGAWYANWAQKLRVVADYSDRRRQAAGSMTPYLLIAKASTVPLKAFVAFPAG